jgi:hypothetical protein
MYNLKKKNIRIIGNKNRKKIFWNIYIFKIIYNYRNIFIYCFVEQKKMNLNILKLYINIFYHFKYFLIIRIKYFFEKKILYFGKKIKYKKLIFKNIYI